MAVEAQVPNQGPRVMTMAEVQLVAVLAEEEVLAADDRPSIAERSMTMMMILIKGGRPTP